MAQSFPTALREQRSAVRSAWYIDVILLLLFAAAAYGIVSAASNWSGNSAAAAKIDLSPGALPRYAGLSVLRMLIAYCLSLAFSLSYARLSILSPTIERIMLPILDLLQSIPVLSFMPGIVLGLVAAFPGNGIGLELAAIILIFTSQAWNLAFGFHQSLKTIPRDLDEAARLYRLHFWQRFTRLELPFGMISLIWNSMMSWAGGWFFLMAAEQFTLGNKSFRLPGLGSYLATAAGKDDISALLLGLLTLIVIIILLDQFVWRPLVAWGERFKVEQVPSGDVPRSWVLTALQRSYLLRRLGSAYERLSQRLAARRPQEPVVWNSSEAQRRNIPFADRFGSWAIGLGALALVGWAISLAIPLLARLQPHDVLTLLGDSGATLVRTLVALLIAVIWTVPVGVWIGMNPKLARRAQPIVQMVASIPATALFPVLLLIFLDLPAGIDIAAVLLMLLGTQWYVLFNVIAGAMAIPSDLREASSIFKMSRTLRWRSLILPAIFPYLVTGMITATGGAWNASIVAEYVSFGSKTVSTPGLGSLIAKAAGSGNFALLLAGTLSMSVVVVLMNRLVWHRLYHLAETRYRLD